MNTYIPSTEDIYRITFITMRGWILDYDGRWKKEGCKRDLTYNEKESNDYALRHKFEPKYDGKDFLLDDAYDFEFNKGHDQSPIMSTHIVYNTGDQIWFIKIGDKTLVTRIITHDGITWLLGDKALSYPYKAPAL